MRERGKEDDSIVASSSLSLLFWGERVIITFLSDDSIAVTSKCALPVQCFDWGKNKANIKKFIAAFDERVEVDHGPEID